ncbi:condensin complex subunit 2 [Clonorchis sinensis]|uniref:Condensin complex subunit 2 n=1 Tax=Clonorchis sinensis TaxID=79923 RepID=G7YS65_CLOSI|nr:condensin complex subunit 2 [Clonorchis sinensis]
MMLTERRQGVENPVQKLDSSDDEFTIQRMVRKVRTSPKPSRLIFEDENDDEDERCARRKSRLLEPHPTTTHSPRPNETSNRRRSDAAAPRGISQTQIGEHYGNCIRLAAENKITAKNAFNLHLIDYMSDMLKNEDYASFQIASSSLDAGAKIYAGRVDAVHQETYQVLTGLGRSDKAPAENAEDCTEGEPGTQHPAKPGQPRKTQPQRDIIQKQLSKIRSKALTSKADVDPLFQHQTSAYDDGGTAELRLNQLRSLDETCTLILDSSTPVIQAVQQTSTESIDVHGLANTIHLLLPSMANQLAMCPSLRNFRFTDWDVSNDSTTLLSLPPSPATPTGGDPLPNDADDHFSDNAIDDDTLVAAPPDEVEQIIPCGSDADAALRNGNDLIERIPSPSEPARQDTDVLADSELFVSSLKSMLGKQYEHFGQLNDHILGMWAGPEHWRKKTKRRRFDPITGLEVTVSCLSRTAYADAQNENVETDVVLVGKDRKASRTKKPKIAKVIYDPARLPSENRTRNGSLARNTWPKGVLSEGVPNSAAANATVYKEQYRQKASKQMNLLPSQWTDVRQTLYQLYNREVILEPTHHSESNLPPNVKGIEPGDMGVAQPNSEFCAILDHPDGPHTITLDAMNDNHLDDEPPDSPICVGDDDDDDMGLPFHGLFTQFTNAQGEFTTLGGLDLVSQPRKVARIEIDYARTAKMINVRRLKLAMWNFLEHTLPHPLNGARSPMSVASTSSAPDGASLTPSLSGEPTAAPEVPGPLASESTTSTQMEGHPDVRVPGAVSFRTLIGSLSSRISWQMAKELSIPIAFNCLLHLSNEKDLYLEPVSGFSDIFVSQGLPQFEIEALKVYQSEHFHNDEIGPDGSAKRHSRSDNVRQKKAKRHRASTLDSWLVDGEPDEVQSPT